MMKSSRGRGSKRVLLSGGDVVLPDRILSPATVVLQDGTISEIAPGTRTSADAPEYVDCTGHLIAPGFIDVHVHGVEGTDTLDGAGAIALIAERLPRFGVTAFCPTSLACAPAELKTMLNAVRASRDASSGSRVLPAHLESNFLNPEYRGAQPLECLRLPTNVSMEGSFSGAEILREIDAAPGDVGIMTIAPEIDGAIDLIRKLASQGIWISLGHTGATYEEALEGIDAGARHATHLFNRMPPLNHRKPGLAAAVLESEAITAEVVCDGVHVHPAVVKMALAVKRPSGIMAITDGTAGSGLRPGAKAAIGGRPITIREAAYLDDGTLAGSVLTMDQAFAKLGTDMKVSLPDAARVCSTTPAEALGLPQTGALIEGWAADVVVLDRDLTVRATYIAGERAWSRE
jgi:N-acetylglucosamine-6-phosphate deacetylase